MTESQGPEQSIGRSARIHDAKSSGQTRVPYDSNPTKCIRGRNVPSRFCRPFAPARRASSAVAAMPRAAPSSPPGAPRRQAVRVGLVARGQLYVSNRPEDHPQARLRAQPAGARRAPTASTQRAAQGVMEFRKVTYKSRVDGHRDPRVPVRAARPSAARRDTPRWSGCTAACTATGARRCARSCRKPSSAATSIITPELSRQHGLRRGALQRDRLRRQGSRRRAVGRDYLKTLPLRRHGPARHDGLEPRRLHHRAHPLPRRAAVQGRRGDRAGDEPGLPALATRARATQRDFATQEGIQGLPFEKRDEYIERSPVFHAEKLKVPILVHVATNDCDVDFRREPADGLHAARAQARPRRDEDLRRSAAGGGRCGHTFNRRVDPTTLERVTTRRSRSTRGTARGRSSSGTCGRTRIARSPRPPVRTRP